MTTQSSLHFGGLRIPDSASRWPFTIALAVFLLLLLVVKRPDKYGDFLEYGAMTVALASHGTPTLDIEDIHKAMELSPEEHFTAPYRQLASGMASNEQAPLPGFYRGRDGYFAIHFFAYPALAAIPYPILDALGVSPFKGFQILNLASMLVLGLCFFRLFQSGLRAAGAMAIFMLCGGALYWNWCSPEMFSAACLLSGMILFVTGAPVRGGLLAGLAAMQNPPIVFFVVFAPILRVIYLSMRGTSAVAAIRQTATLRYLGAVAIVVVLFAIPPLFNIWQFGEPSIIAKYSTNVTLISARRLGSFFFDLNQGMVIGIPALMLFLILGTAWRRCWREWLALAVVVAFAIALAVPALSSVNWNSGASGLMRYAFWGSMPLFFAFLLWLRNTDRWPVPVLLVLVVVQAASMFAAKRYGYVEFSPVAKMVMARFPGLYNPEAEIFYERSRQADVMAMDSGSVTAYTVGERAVKTLYNVAGAQDETRICGAGAGLSPENRVVDVGQGWRFINGDVRCQRRFIPVEIGARRFMDSAVLRLGEGWSEPEFGGGNWDGAWTNGPVSKFVIPFDASALPTTITIAGHYHRADQVTRVTVNGVDLGSHRLDAGGPLELPARATKGGATLDVELAHSPLPLAGHGGDRRQLAFFLRQISVR